MFSHYVGLKSIIGIKSQLQKGAKRAAQPARMREGVGIGRVGILSSAYDMHPVVSGHCHGV